MKLVITALANVLYCMYVSQCGVLEICKLLVHVTWLNISANLAVVSMSQYRLITWVSTQFTYTVCRQTGWHMYSTYVRTCVFSILHSLFDWVDIRGQWFFDCHWLLHEEGRYCTYVCSSLCGRIVLSLPAPVLLVIGEQVEREYASYNAVCAKC